MRGRITLFLFCFLLLSNAAYAAQGQAYELGYVSGKLTFTAMLLDIFSDICPAKAGYTSGYFQSIDDLPREKLGVSFSDIRHDIQEASGKNLEVEATTRVIEMMRENRGCDTFQTTVWVSEMENTFQNELTSFKLLLEIM